MLDSDLTNECSNEGIFSRNIEKHENVLSWRPLMARKAKFV